MNRCNAGDTQCIIELVNGLISTHPGGFPEVGLEQIDPFLFTNATISQNNNGPVTINLRLTDGRIIGWQHLKITKIV